MMSKIEEIKIRTAELLEYAHEYYDLDSPTISDATYDKLYDELKVLEDKTGFWLANSPTRKVQGETLPYLTKVKHSVPMLSADKSTDIEDVKKFIGNHNIVMSYKLDGATVVLKYQDGQFIQALSRGSGIEGEDITHAAKMIKNLPMTIPYKGYLEVRGEALIPWKYYNEMNVNGDMGHPRNVASGGLRQLSADESAKRNIYFYAFTLVNWKLTGVETKSDSLQFLKEQGFDVVPNEVIYPEELEKAIEFFDRTKYENPTDGWCFEYEDLFYGDSLGSTGHHDRRLFALKPDIEEYETTLKDIEWTMGKTGVLTPTAVFEPVEIDSTIIERASLHNISIMKKIFRGAYKGQPIKIYKANMIIPQVSWASPKYDGVSEMIWFPTECPICHSKVEIVKENESEVLVCKNDNCSGKLLGKLSFFVSKKAMDINNLSEATLEFLINKGWVKKYADLYHLDQYADEWVRCEGFGKKSIEKILAAIEKSRNVDLAHFITALSIPGVGSSAAKLISEQFNGDFDTMVQKIIRGFDFTTIEGFGETINANIQRFFYDMLSVIDLANELHFIIEEKKTVSGINFEGLSFCITGGLTHFANRDALVADIEAHGGKFVSSVSAKCNYLINNDSTSGSSKNKKAQSLSIPIITEEEYIKLKGE